MYEHKDGQGFLNVEAPNHEHASLGEDPCFMDHTQVMSEEEEMALATLDQADIAPVESLLGALEVLGDRVYLNPDRLAIQVVGRVGVIGHFAMDPARFQQLQTAVEQQDALRD